MPNLNLITRWYLLYCSVTAQQHLCSKAGTWKALLWGRLFNRKIAISTLIWTVSQNKINNTENKYILLSFKMPFLKDKTMNSNKLSQVFKEWRKKEEWKNKLQCVPKKMDRHTNIKICFKPHRECMSMQFQYIYIHTNTHSYITLLMYKCYSKS